MKKYGFFVLVVVLIPLAIHAQQRFVAALGGGQEVPVSGSGGVGTCHIVLNAPQTQITVNCTFSGLGSNAVAAHIHGDGAVGANAPVLFGFTGVPSAASGTIGPLTFDVTPQQVSSMRAHLFYVNIHSVNFSGGEIRGQFKQAHTVGDNDGDGRTDLTIFRPSTTQLWTLSSLNGSVLQKTVGVNPGTYYPGSGDFEGDGIGSHLFINFDLGSGQIIWNLLSPNAPPTIVSRLWGDFNDYYAVADYDGDGSDDIAIFRPSTGDWWIMTDPLTQTSYVDHWGTTDDAACIGDYDGDGKSDLCVVRIEAGQRVWYIRNSTDGSMRREVYGLDTDRPLAYAYIDIDGDSKQDLSILRINAGPQRIHFIRRSSDGQSVQIAWGRDADQHFFGDYDGDGKTDFVARRIENGAMIWYIRRSSDGQAQIVQWGVQGDG